MKPSAQAPQPKRIAVLIETSTTWGAMLIRGISRYAKEQGPWLFHLEPRGRSEPARLPEGWRGDGVLARVNNPELAAELEGLGIPTVDVSWFNYADRFAAKCSVSARGIARTAVRHFLERGLRRVGYCGPTGRPEHSDLIPAAFAEEAVRHGMECSFYSGITEAGAALPWNESLESCASWLRSLGQPSGILAFSDVRGRHVAEACTIAGLSVPDDVAILGSEQDELSAMVSSPPLSSIDVGAQRVGHAAAETLDKMMKGEARPETPVLFDPLGVICRQSTDIVAVDDPIVARACRLIADRFAGQSSAQASGRFGVEDLLDELGVSRRLLENRFNATLKRTPGAVIRRRRLEHAARMLVDDEHTTVSEIAAACGFSNTESLSRAFRDEFGCPPSTYRNIEHHPKPT